MFIYHFYCNELIKKFISLRINRDIPESNEFRENRTTKG